MNKIEQAPLVNYKRRYCRNRWDNIIAYVGSYRVWDFGLDVRAAKEWVKYGKFQVGGLFAGWRALVVQTHPYYPKGKIVPVPTCAPLPLQNLINDIRGEFEGKVPIGL